MYTFVRQHSCIEIIKTPWAPRAWYAHVILCHVRWPWCSPASVCRSSMATVQCLSHKILWFSRWQRKGGIKNITTTVAFNTIGSYSHSMHKAVVMVWRRGNRGCHYTAVMVFWRIVSVSSCKAKPYIRTYTTVTVRRCSRPKAPFLPFAYYNGRTHIHYLS